jgi:2-keto-4-pentenoate hydratase/2-oxohepta-3-ene-1,7-dioic acid hydratase in catechol pathway
VNAVGRALVDGRSVAGRIADGQFQPCSGTVFALGDPTGARIPLDEVKLLSPTDPRKVLIQMGGFMPADGSPLPPGAVPWLLPKLTSSVSGQDGEVVVPSGISKTWAEVEVAIVIGRRVRSADETEAAGAILGYTCFNDVSAPEFLAAHDYWRTKSIETFASMGPWICTDLTQDDLDAGLNIVVRVNGKTQGEGNTKKLKYPMAQMVSFASRYTTLEPGDVISVGTPKPCEVQPGDLVELEVERIGTLRNRIVAGA